ncbi:50S ribosomal protein L10 [Candidatus Jorgensenbacteria bacterium CG10_big_fil_rev_8_21_14_0_10_54_38]|uniref:Large ribosomal subunit protein uL10 n=2 Tax=Candidatus Joergenseniibacteriota TaxID=1752739 RepID=A0A2M6WFP1_9BACT|nr:MAG: 50S ribosomal protein L10 [Candidatus Jorgensenbacteria bacterium CG23_combo_of_CG06-09_8_20_14_all_54_14]PIT91534.1 MAG: 50S ribosomal protein L10 [Candidatus Jorgensenbacteria bacterium CG10_big_fil_rev_8_21_14_0_10_54_38]
MKTKAQKQQTVETGVKDLKWSETVIVADFTGIPTAEMNVLRKSLRAMGAVFHVVKKRLLKIIFEKEGIAVDPKQFAGQTGVVFSPKDMVETAGAVYRFGTRLAASLAGSRRGASAKREGKVSFKILGGLEVKEKKFMDGADVECIGALPGREALLGQLAYILTAPIKKFLFVLNEKIKMVEK